MISCIKARLESSSISILVSKGESQRLI